jgi:epsilon-lactone hydrolase
MRWDVDDRRASLHTRVYVAAMWLRRDERAFEGAGPTLGTARERQRAGDRGPTPWTRLLTRVDPSRSNGLDLWTARLRHRRPVARVLYLHGGGYVHPLTADYWRLVRALVGAPAVVEVPPTRSSSSSGTGTCSAPASTSSRSGSRRRTPASG